MPPPAPPPLRDRQADPDPQASFVELFFDLVFVFTVIQLSLTLEHDLSPRGLVRTAVLILAVWWVWIFTTWTTNWLDPQDLRVRLMLFALMFGGLVLATSIPQAYADRGLAFALAFAAMQVGRSLFMLWAFPKEDRRHERNFERVTVWLTLSGAIWIAGGLAGPDLRLALWALAIGLEFLGPALGFAVPGLGRSQESDWDIAGRHMAERCALFVILCLGETVIATGRAFVAVQVTLPHAAGLAMAFLNTVILWWVYFRFGHGRGALVITEARVPGPVARWAFTYAHVPIVLGIILKAVGAAMLVRHPEDPVGPAQVAAITGGAAVFLGGNLWFKTLVARRVPRSHLWGLAGLAGIAALASEVSLLTLAGLTAGVLFGVTLAESRDFRGLRRHGG